jgi:hypothetical protein
MGESGKSVVLWHWRAYEESLHAARKGADEDSETATDGGSVVAEEQEETGHAEAEEEEEVEETEEETAEEVEAQEESTEEKTTEAPEEKFKDFMTIRELNAKGFKNLADQPSNSQDSKGKGYWENGKWKVMITRPLITGDKKIDIQFETGKLIPYALAVWDGSNKEIGGQKSITSWYYLTLEMPTPKSVYFYVIIAVIMAVSIQFWVIGRIRRFPTEIPAE